MKTKLHPQVIELLKPIIMNTTKLYEKMKYANNYPVFGQIKNSESDEEKRIKRECVHMVFEPDGSIKYIPEDCDKPGYQKCPVCHKLVPLKFEEKNEETLLDSIDVLNQLVFFGAMLGLRADALKVIIGVKSVMPDLVQLNHELNDYVKLDSSNADSMENLAAEYNKSGMTYLS